MDLVGSTAYSSGCEQWSWAGKRCIINCFIYMGTFLWPFPSLLGCWTVLFADSPEGHQEQELAWRRAPAPSGSDGAIGSDVPWLHSPGLYLGTGGQRQACIWIASLALSSFTSLITVMLMPFSHLSIFRKHLDKSMCGASHDLAISVELRGWHIWNVWPVVIKDRFWKCC